MLLDSAAEGNGWGQTRPSQAWRNGPFFLLYLVPLVFYGWLKPVWDIGGSFIALLGRNRFVKSGFSWKLVPFCNNTMFVLYHEWRGYFSQCCTILGIQKHWFIPPKIFRNPALLFIIFYIFYVIIVNLKACSAGGQIIN